MTSCAHGGTEASPVPAPFGCLGCGAAGCPACTVHLESAVYCWRCAAALLGTTALRAAGAFTLH